jgi:hypothetical protein
MAEVEDRIRADPEWRKGVGFASEGVGHPEATVSDHVDEVLANVDRLAPPEMRERLRTVALVHDAMKHRVIQWLPGRGDHARIAARFARRYVQDPHVLKVIARHDDAYRAWRWGRRTGQWWLAEWLVRRLIADLGDALEMFRVFYRCDNETGDKAPDDRIWFEEVLSRTGPQPRRHRPPS